MKRFAALMIAVLAAIAVSVALVGCDEKPNDAPVLKDKAVFDGGEAGVYEVLYGEKRGVVFECDENKTYFFKVTYLLSDGSQISGAQYVIKGDEIGTHKLGEKMSAFVDPSILIVVIKPKPVDAEVSFDPMGAISVTDKDGETEYTYKYDGQPHHPYMQVKYNGQIVAKDVLGRGFFHYAKVINPMNYTINGSTTLPVSEIGTYKVFYDVMWQSYIDPYNGDNFNKIDKTYVIVKIIP